MRYDFFNKTLYIRVLDTEMEGAGFPVFEVLGAFIVFELEHFNTNFIASRHVSNFKRAPAFAKNVNTHIWPIGVSDSSVITVGFII